MNHPAFLPLSSPLALRSVSRRSPARCLKSSRYVIPPRMGMQVKTAPLPNSQVSMEISVGSEECAAAWDSVIRELTKKSNISGFRKGKAPKQIVINEFGRETVMASACEEVIEKSVSKAIKDSGIHAIGQAEMDEEGGVASVVKMFNLKDGLKFKIKIDVWPEAKFTEEYVDMEVEAEEAPFDEALIDKALQDLREKEAFSVLASEGSEAKLGQLLVANMRGFYRLEDGSKGDKLPEIADGDNIEIKMEEGKFMPGFVEGLMGAKAGETRDVNVDFPTQNPRKELAGVKAIFEVTVGAIKDVVLPELNDEFVKQVSEDNSLEEFRETIRTRLDVETEQAQERNINTGIENKLSTIVEVDLPESLVENQCKNKFASMLTSFRDNGMSESQVKAMVTKENYELYKTRARVNVEKSLRVNFAISKIAKDQGFEVKEEEVEDQIALVRAELKGEEMDEERVRDQVEAALEKDAVLKFIKESAKISLVPPPKVEEEPAKK